MCRNTPSRARIALIAGLMILVSAGLTCAQDAQIPGEALQLIEQAGNATSELERLEALRQARQVEGVPDAVAEHLDLYISISMDWLKDNKPEPPGGGEPAEGAYLLDFYHQKVSPWAKDIYPPEVGEDSPLYPFWCFHRARFLIWRGVQGGLSREQREAAVDLMRIADEAYPENRLIDMYLGTPMRDWPTQCEPDPNAPDWANWQRESLEGLTDIAHWWIDNRQLEDGSFGGGWGDDCEMWKFWPVLIIGFEDPKLAASEAKLANGMFAAPHMEKGFTSNMADVEHCAEDTSDTITPMMHLDRDNDLWIDRARFTAELMRNLWTGVNQRGMLQFKSIWFNVNEVRFDAKWAADTVYHPKVVQPAMLLWQRTGDENLGQLFSMWMDTWVDITAREENGKPAGAIPSGIAWPTGEVAVGESGKWWDLDRTLYDWPSFMLATTNSLLLTYHMTGDEKYLEPIRSMARIRAQYLGTPEAESPEAGSAPWCAVTMNAGQSYFLNSLAKYRLLTGDDQFDELLLTEASPYMRYRLDGDIEKLAEALLENVEAFRVNWAARTTECRYTDRLGALGAWSIHRMPRPNTRILYATATGDPDIGLSYFPMNAVRWLTEPREIAALVTDASPQALEAMLYHFGDEARPMQAELFLLQPGRYTLRLRTAGDAAQTLDEQAVTVEGQVTPVSFELPPRQLCVLEVR